MGGKVFFLVFSIYCILTGCAKEYSFEGANVPPPPPADTIPVPIEINEFPVCSACISPDTLKLSSWKFSVGNSVLCGMADTAIATFGRNAFTFFGPSSCAGDTGMVITVYLGDEKLNRDRKGFYAIRTAFYYYERVTPSYIFISRSDVSFSTLIESYDHQNKIVTGSFQGFAFRSNGIAAEITNGKFKMKLL